MEYSAQHAAQLILNGRHINKVELANYESGELVVASKYTMTIPISGNRLLAFNAQNHSFAIFEDEDLNKWRIVESGEQTLGNSNLQDFLKLGFAIPKSHNELEAIREQYKAQSVVALCTNWR